MLNLRNKLANAVYSVHTTEVKIYLPHSLTYLGILLCGYWFVAADILFAKDDELNFARPLYYFLSSGFLSLSTIIFRTKLYMFFVF